MGRSPAIVRSPIRFGVFELDPRAGELRKNGAKLKIEGQPVQILAVLLEHPGEVLTREELKQRLWPGDTFVDFDHSINAAVNRLRQALDDSAETPRYIETLPRRGYRFIYPLHEAASGEATAKAVKPAWLTASIVAVAMVGAVALLVGRAGQRAAEGAPPAIRSIAVLPLENLTGDPEQEYFADGIHDEILTRLAQVSELKVTSRTSVLRYKTARKALPEIARELGVEAIVEGSVRQVDGRLRVTAQLIHAGSDKHLWASVYERDASQIATLPGDIAKAIAGRLKIPLSGKEEALLGRQGGADPELFRLQLKASYFERKWTRESLQKAVELYQQALDRDPTYAPAWLGLGTSFEELARHRRDEQLRSRAKAAVLRALELDDRSRAAHQFLGRAYLREWNWTAAEQHFRRAQELDPSWQGPVLYYTVVGRFDDAIHAGRADLERDPLNLNTSLVLGWAYFMAGRHDEAITQLKSTLELDASSRLPHYQLAWNYAKKGMFAEAVAECDTHSQPQPELGAGDNCGWVYALAGRQEQARDFLARVQRSRGDSGEASEIQAKIYDALGERGKALAALSRAYEQRAPGLMRLKVAPMYSAAMRGDPRFQEVLRRIGVPDQPGALIARRAELHRP